MPSTTMTMTMTIDKAVLKIRGGVRSGLINCTWPFGTFTATESGVARIRGFARMVRDAEISREDGSILFYRGPYLTHIRLVAPDGSQFPTVFYYTGDGRWVLRQLETLEFQVTPDVRWLPL